MGHISRRYQSLPEGMQHLARGIPQKARSILPPRDALPLQGNYNPPANLPPQENPTEIPQDRSLYQTESPPYQDPAQPILVRQIIRRIDKLREEARQGLAKQVEQRPKRNLTQLRSQ